ncbi:MAG TPA: Npt1/Npt2 family nucleotide transporter [Candidatus Babeliales bacterium]|jgi:AAA family ATP:ADP antiporter|nr:Npt1/Npt2 family nucleotide transporter [Candidatus Babeliales bacterium]
MVSKVTQMVRGLFDIEPQERMKLFFLSLLYFLVVGAYTVTRDLKSSIFLGTVGKEYIPWVKVISMLILVPAIFFYSRLVDKIRRYQLLVFYSVLFGVANLIFAYFIGHPTIGILNTDAQPNRLFGWFFYFFVEGYSPFVVSVFWALANSVNSPAEAKRNYGYMVAGSKLGGMAAAALAWYIFGLSAQLVKPCLTHVQAHQLILIISSLFLALVPAVAIMFIRTVPGYLMHGYEAAYQLEKHKKTESKPSVFAGLEMFLKYPYVLGIFGMVFFYEVVSTVLGYLRLGVAEAGAQHISDVSRVLFEIAFKAHLVGFVISLVGTQALLARLGTRICLMLIPFSMGVCLFYLIFETSPESLRNAFVVFTALNYAFLAPVRESLYLPTVKEIKFKSKSWIDAFGSKFAKSAGSTFNFFTSKMGETFILPAHSFFFAGVIVLWFGVAFLLGRRFDQAVAKNEVIGVEE